MAFGRSQKKVIVRDPVHGLFDSKSEYKYFLDLLRLQEQGYIKLLERQLPRFDYPLSSSTSKKSTGYYKADFHVIDYKDREHIIDVKGDPKDPSLVKIAFIEYMYGIQVKVIKTREQKENKCWKYPAMDTSFITAK